MKNTLALLLLITLAFTACKNNPKNNADDEAKKAQELAEKKKKEIETKSYEAVKARLMSTTFRDSLLTLDTLTIKEIDTATEKNGKAKLLCTFTKCKRSNRLLCREARRCGEVDNRNKPYVG